MTALPIHLDPLQPRSPRVWSNELALIKAANPCPSCTWEGHWRIPCLRCRNEADRGAA